MHILKKQYLGTLAGILLSSVFALISFYFSQLPQISALGINSLIIAIILGILFGNTLRQQLPESWGLGFQFSAKRVLRLAIILYGFRVSLQQIAAVGIEGFALDLFVVVSTLVIGIFVGRKILKLDRDLSILVSVGAAICGAAAVLAIEDVLKSEPYKTAVAVGTVVVFGTVSMFLYPFLQHIGVFTFTPNQFGLFAGASIHEVAQAMVAGAEISQQAGDTAVIVKMIRVLMLVPVIFIFSVMHSAKKDKTQTITNITVPWFAVAFIIVIVFNSFGLLSIPLVTRINQLDGFLLTMAMAAIGIETNLKKVKQVGLKPLFLAILLFIWLGISVYIIVAKASN